jgi:hypothetical protein
MNVIRGIESCGVASSLPRPQKTKKADVVECLKVAHHVGLLFNEPPSSAGLFFI